MTHKILLIEDDNLVAKSIYGLLKRQGYSVEHAASAVDAVSLVANNDFDLILSDIRMPGESGIVAIEKIQNIYKNRSHKAAYIFISGYAEEDSPEHAIRLGVSKFIYKPFDSKYLLQSIQDELVLVEKEREATHAEVFTLPPNIPKLTSNEQTKKRVPNSYQGTTQTSFGHRRKHRMVFYASGKARSTRHCDGYR